MLMGDLEAILNAQQDHLRHLRLMRPKCCPLHSDLACNLDEVAVQFWEGKRPYAFVMRPYRDEFVDMEAAAREILSEMDGLDFFIAQNTYDASVPLEGRKIATIVAKDEDFDGRGYCQICRLALFANFGIAELATLNPNVLLEIGLMYGFGKSVILTLEERMMSLKQLPFDLLGQRVVPYKNYPALRTGLQRQVEAVVKQLRERCLL